MGRGGRQEPWPCRGMRHSSRRAPKPRKCPVSCPVGQASLRLAPPLPQCFMQSPQTPLPLPNCPSFRPCSTTRRLRSLRAVRRWLSWCPGGRWTSGHGAMRRPASTTRVHAIRCVRVCGGATAAGSREQTGTPLGSRLRGVRVRVREGGARSEGSSRASRKGPPRFARLDQLAQPPQFPPCLRPRPRPLPLPTSPTLPCSCWATAPPPSSPSAPPTSSCARPRACPRCPRPWWRCATSQRRSSRQGRKAIGGGRGQRSCGVHAVAPGPQPHGV